MGRYRPKAERYLTLLLGIVGGIIGPWYLGLVTDGLRPSGGEVHYIVLRPPLEVALVRAMARVADERVPGHRALVEEEPIRLVWEAFGDLGPHEGHVIDNGPLDPAETATLVWTRFVNGADRLT